MAKVLPIVSLPGTNPTKRDINFTSDAEAQAVANSFLTIVVAPGVSVPDPALTTDISIVEMVPEAANTNPADGRKWYQVQFTRTQTVTNSQGRQQDVPVAFDLNAGICLDDEVNNPLLPWKYLAESTGTDTWTGDVER